MFKKLQKIKTPKILKPLFGNLLLKKEPDYGKPMEFPVGAGMEQEQTQQAEKVLKPLGGFLLKKTPLQKLKKTKEQIGELSDIFYSGYQGVTNVKETFREGWMRGVLQTGSAMERIASVGVKKAGFDELSERIETLADKDKELSRVGIDIVDSRKFREKVKDPHFIAGGVAQNLPNMLLAMGAGIPAVAVGAPTAVVGAIAFSAAGLLEAGFAYDDAKEFGADDATAEKTAGIVGVINGLLEVIPITKLLTRTKVGKDIKRSLIREITQRVVTQTTLEAGTESIQEIVSNSVATVYDKNRDLLAGVPEAGFFGGIMGGGVSTIADVASIAKPKGLTIEEVEEKKVEPVEKYKITEKGIEFNITKQEAETKLRQFFDEKEVKFLTTERVGKFEAGEVYGKYTNALIKLVEQKGKVSDMVAYHEAFHAYFDLFAEVKQKKVLLEHIIKKYKGTNIWKEKMEMYGEDYIKKGMSFEQSSKRANNKVAEEILADGFSTYLMTGKSISISRIFLFYRKMTAQIKRWIGKQDRVIEMYEDIIKRKRPDMVREPSKEIKYKKTEPKSLKTIIRTEAESLKEIEAGKGLVVIKGKRVTEHSPAYSAFYKEQGRRPVSMPDWEMIAEAELESGISSIGQVETFRATTEGGEAVTEEINVKEIFETMDSQAKMDRLVRANMISKQEKAEFIKTLKADLARAFERTRQLTPFEGKRVARAFEEYIKTSGIKDRIIAMPEAQLLKIRIKGEVRGAIEGERVGRVETRIKVRAQIKERQTKQALRSKIIKELKDTKVRKQAGKPVGKFTPEVQITLNKLREASKFTKSERELKIQNNLEKYKDSIPPDEVALENKILSMIAGMEEMSISELGNILAQVQTIKETGKLTADLKKFNRQADIDQWVNKAIDIVTGGKGLPANISTIGIRELRPEILKEKVQKFIGTTGRIFFGWDNMLDMIARKTKIEPGKTWLDTFADVTTQKNAVKRGERINTDKIRKFAQETLSVKNDRQLVKRFQDDAMEMSLGTFKNKQGIMTEIIYTKAEARKAWMELQDPTLKQSFEEGMNYTDAIIKAIENFLTEQDKAFAQKQLDFYKDYYKGVNDIYRDIYGVDLPKNEFYSPIKREGIARDESTGFGEFLQEISIRKSVTSGSLKSRIKNIKPLHKQSDIAVLEQHIAEMEHFKGWAHKIRDLRAVFGNPQVRTAIIREHGKGLLATIDNFLNDFTRGGIEIASRLDSLDRLRGNYSRAVLAIKPAIGIKQLTSFIAYADVVPAVEFGKWTIDFWKNPIERIRILKQSEMMKVRGKYMERDIKTALRSDAYASFRKHPSFLNTLMLNIQAGDQGAIYAGGWAVYKYQRGLGKTHKEALHIFERETSNVQQSADLDNLSQWQRSGSFAKLFTMFGSAPNMFFRKEMGAIRNVVHGRGTYRQHAKTILIFHFLIPMFFQWISDFFKWDPEEQKRAAIFGSFNGIFIVKDGLEYLIRGALGMRQFSSEIPILGIAKDLDKATKLINDDDITTEDVFKAIRGLAGASGSLTGLPLKQPIDISTGIKDILQGEYAQGLAEILGWSPYIAEKRFEEKKKPGELPSFKEWKQKETKTQSFKEWKAKSTKP